MFQRWLTRSLLAAAVSFMMNLTNGPLRADEPGPDVTYAIAIHGGAGARARRTREETEAIREALAEALRRGRDALASGGASVDAVELAIRCLEDSPLFNAGKGATFNLAGRHELDASIMRGEDLAAGAVAGVTVAKNPISLARRVLTDTKHVLLVGEGADRFAKEIDVELATPDYFWTDKTRAEWQAAQSSDDRQGRAEPAVLKRDVPVYFGTVGCVALDERGNLAAGTSTGGLKMKRVGRVGDSPLIGAGTYADNAACAVSCTGLGELFIRHAVAYDIAARIRYGGATLSEAARTQIDQRLPAGSGGLIALGLDGEIVAPFNTAAMPRGMADSSGRFEIHIDPQ
jgi:beta-aspartyl-peptidase (threonine type)